MLPHYQQETKQNNKSFYLFLSMSFLTYPLTPSDNLTINFWPAIIFAAVIVISEWYLHYFCDLLRILVIKRCYVGSLAFI